VIYLCEDIAIATPTPVLLQKISNRLEDVSSGIGKKERI
jgi:hypothetical protein